MIRKLSYDQELMEQRVEIRAGHAVYPLPFRQVLEFNPPVHETWNIVHIGMNMPEAHQVYICGINCMRGVVLTAAEMNCLDRFHCVTIDEHDIISGNLEDITADGIADVLRKLPQLPPAVIVFTVCTHHFLGSDLNYIYRKLENTFPEIRFVRAYMDPLLQKESPTPDMKLRTAMYGVLESENKANDVFTAAILGSNVALDQDNDINAMFASGKDGDRSAQLLQAPACRTYDEFCRMGQADIFLANVPNGLEAAELTAERLGKRFLNIPMCFSYERIRKDLEALRAAAEDAGFRLSALDYDAEEKACEKEMDDLRDLIGDTEIRIDYVSHPRPVGLARFLIERGFNVTKVYLNSFMPDDEENVEWMRTNAPDLHYAATVQPECRVLERGRAGSENERPVLAIGPQAAWFSDTEHFVNIIEGGGLYGYRGIRQLAALIKDAFENTKDTEDIVPRKGLGCESCV